MFYDPRSQPHGLAYNPWLALIVPRPIAWVSTLGTGRVPNLAPFSSFGSLSANPAFLMFACNQHKDTINNAEASGVFCINIATYDLHEAMNVSSGPFPSQTDEFAVAGLTATPCENIDCVRVAESPVAIECRLSQVITLQPSNGPASDTRVVIGEAVGIHIDESVIRDGRVDIDLLKPLGRLGYMDYTVASTSFEMMRPALTSTGGLKENPKSRKA